MYWQDYTHYITSCPYRLLVYSVLLEDFVHWWVLHPVVEWLTGAHLSIWTAAFLFGLGHIDVRSIRASVKDRTFWIKAFAVMPFGALFYWIAVTYGRFYTTA